MPDHVANLARRRVLEIAREYEGRGYEVVVRPYPSELPDFLARFRPDLIARGPEESVVVEVKTRGMLAGSEELGAIAEAVRGRPGWRFELDVIGAPPGEDAGEVAEPLGEAGLHGRALEARALLDQGFASAAMVLGWSAAEGALRLVAQRNGVVLEDRGPGYMAKGLYTLGLIDREVLDILLESVRSRNAIVHGFRAADPDPEGVSGLIEAVERLLALPPIAEAAGGK